MASGEFAPRDLKHRDVEQFVRDRAGTRLPGEREMAEFLGISRVRLRAVLEVLEAEGLVQRRQGSGTYALAPREGELRRVVILADASLKLGDDPFFSLLVERLQGELQGAGSECVVQRTQGDSSLPECEGVIALGAAGLAALGQLKAGGPTAVGLLGAPPGRRRRLSVLELEDEGAGSQAACRLAEAGVGRVYFYGRCDIPAVRERAAGARRELQAAGIPFEIVECGLNYTAGMEQGGRLADRAVSDPDPTPALPASGEGEEPMPGAIDFPPHAGGLRGVAAAPSDPAPALRASGDPTPALPASGDPTPALPASGEGESRPVLGGICLPPHAGGLRGVAAAPPDPTPALSACGEGEEPMPGAIDFPPHAGGLRGVIGVIAANDWLAMGLHTGIQGRDPELRRRIRLVSFDGLAVARRPELGIESLAVPLEAIAADTIAELRRLHRPGAIPRTIRYTLTWCCDQE